MKTLQEAAEKYEDNLVKAIKEKSPKQKWIEAMERVK
jgi:hypothetical protein